MRNNKGQFIKGTVPWIKGITFSDETKKKMSLSHTGKKLSKETRLKISKINKGRIGTMKGKKHTLETRKLMSEQRKGNKSYLWKGGKPKCLECPKILSRRQSKLCARCRFKGNRNPLWKGGITPLTRHIRQTFEYRQWHSDIFTRDNWTCQNCNQRGGELNVDHFPKMFSEIITEYKITSIKKALNCLELWNINNGRTLCLKCHKLIGKKK